MSVNLPLPLIKMNRIVRLGDSFASHPTRRHESIIVLYALLDRKRHEMDKIRRDDDLLAIKFRKDAEDYKHQLQLNRQSQVDKQNQYRDLLDHHVTLRKEEDINLTGMGDKERKINFSELSKLRGDKDLYLKVMRKIGLQK